jgi:hypothetical protein
LERKGTRIKHGGAFVQEQVHLTQSVFKVVLQTPIPTQIRQLILHISNSTGKVDGFVGGLAYAKRLSKYFV